MPHYTVNRIKFPPAKKIIWEALRKQTASSMQALLVFIFVKICVKDLVPRFQDPGFANLHRKTLEKVSEGNFNFAP